MNNYNRNVKLQYNMVLLTVMEHAEDLIMTTTTTTMMMMMMMMIIIIIII